MKKIVIISLFVIFLSSCSVDWKDEARKKNQELEKEISILKEENKKLKEEIQTIGSSLGGENLAQATYANGISAPENMTYAETSNKKCYDAAQEAFMEAGNKECERMGWTKDDMLAHKCKLPKSFIDEISQIRKNAELACGPGE